MKKVLIDIPKYCDLKKYNLEELNALASTIRRKLIEIAKTHSIHLSSNLGIVELTIALLYFFNSPNDKIIFDTGHQSYVHKILTDRFNEIEKVRCDNGISGFQDPNESIHDFISSGHSSTSLSICEGANESEFNIKKNYIPVIGDASIANGLAFEALNNIAFNKTRMLIILNDNGMSISENVGYLHLIFNKLKKHSLSFESNNFKKDLYGKKINEKINIFFKKTIEKIGFHISGKNFFESLGFKYIGVVDGNNIEKLLQALKKANQESKYGPVILHVKTIKGLGYSKAEKDKIGYFHSCDLTKININNENYYGNVAANFIEKLTQIDKNIMVYNSAMTYSTGFLDYAKKFPNNYEDVGIAEAHMITKASGAALVGRKVFICIYSTFLQRAYDNVLHDVSRLNLPIVFLIDRAEISYHDGDTHHGIYDVAFLKSMINPIICSPSNKFELERLIMLGYHNKFNPFFIRYSKDKCLDYVKQKDFEFGDWIYVQKKMGSKKCIISYGNLINEIKNNLNNSHDFDVINAIFITHYNQEKVLKILKNYRNIFVIEKVVDPSCLANDLILLSYQNGLNVKLHKFNLKKTNIGFGSKNKIEKENGLEIKDIIKKIIKIN